jgi:hypothetical protein
VIDACAVSLRFAAATPSRDTLRSGPFTVGRAEAREIAVRTSTIPIHVTAMPKRQPRTKHEQRPSLARRPRPRRPPSLSECAKERTFAKSPRIVWNDPKRAQGIAYPAIVLLARLQPRDGRKLETQLSPAVAGARDARPVSAITANRRPMCSSWVGRSHYEHRPDVQPTPNRPQKRPTVPRRVCCDLRCADNRAVDRSLLTHPYRSGSCIAGLRVPSIRGLRTQAARGFAGASGGQHLPFANAVVALAME